MMKFKHQALKQHLSVHHFFPEIRNFFLPQNGRYLLERKDEGAAHDLLSFSNLDFMKLFSYFPNIFFQFLTKTRIKDGVFDYLEIRLYTKTKKFSVLESRYKATL